MTQTPAEQEEARQEKLARQRDGDEPEGQGDGERAEVGQLNEDQANDPIYPDQAVAGYPDSEGGGPDEGPAGPNAAPAAGPTTDEPA